MRRDRGIEILDAQSPAFQRGLDAAEQLANSTLSDR
jgi:hypothetical protein